MQKLNHHFNYVGGVTGFLQKHDIDEETLIQLCGGVTTNVYSLNAVFKIVSDIAIAVDIETNAYTVSRVINFAYRLINNTNMEVFNKGQGVGTALFLSQVKACLYIGFARLNVIADGGWPVGEKDGYYRWGRLGYTMSGYDQQEFRELMLIHERTEKNLGELLLTKEGYRFWKEHGFNWTGYFLTVNGSENLVYLKNYLTRKEINFAF